MRLYRCIYLPAEQDLKLGLTDAKTAKAFPAHHSPMLSDMFSLLFCHT